MEPRAESNRRDDTKADPVDNEERVLPDPLDVDLMFARDVPKGEERDEKQRQQRDRLLMVQNTSFIYLKERRGLKHAIFNGQDRMSPQLDVLALLPQSFFLR